MRPPLIHIGYNKTGSTWLQEEFFPLQELGFYLLLEMEDRRKIYRYLVKEHALYYEEERVRTYYEERISHAGDLLPVLSAERLSGDPHSGGYDSVEVAGRLHSLFPEAKILLVVREQRSMLLSVYTQYVRAGGTRSLRRYLRPPLRGSRRMPQFDFRFLDYAPLVEHYMGLFGRERVKVLPYEWLLSEPQRFLREILQFSDLATPERLERIKTLPFGKRVNRSYGPFTLWAKRLYNRFFLDNSLNPAALFHLPEGIERRAVRCFQFVDAFLPAAMVKNAKRRRAALISRAVENRYAKGNERLCEITGLDLKKLGYL